MSRTIPKISRCSPEIPNMLVSYRFKTSLSTHWKEFSRTFLLLLAVLLLATSCQKHSSPEKLETEGTFFQKLTGDDPEDQKSRWNQVFNTGNYVFGKEPAAFLKEKIHLIPVGRALDIAMGEGRNTVFLAKKGFAAEGVDISEVAIRKAKLLAREHSVEIKTKADDLNSYTIAPETYALVVNIQYLQRSLIPRIKAGLKHGGYVLFENTTEEELQRLPGQNLQRDFLLEKGELRRLFADFEIVDYSEGPGENGQIVARLLARKP